jgi:hypothetical protein
LSQVSLVRKLSSTSKLLLDAIAWAIAQNSLPHAPE